MTYAIRKQFGFSASHQLNGLPEDHQCSRLHGHNYTVTLELAAETLDETGFVVDYGDLRPFKQAVEDLDHRHLNDICPFNPTAENLARWLFDMAIGLWPQTVAVMVEETPKTWAEYRP